MPKIQILNPEDQAPFRPIHFAALTSDGKVHVFVWKNLDDAVQTLKNLLPGIRSFLTAEHIRGLAAPDREVVFDSQKWIELGNSGYASVFVAI